MKQRLFWFYLVLVHLALLVVVAKPDWLLRLRAQLLGRSSEVPAWYADLHGFYRRQDLQLPSGRLVFVGDSHIQGLAVANISANAVNFGIGGDTTQALQRRLPEYRAVQTAQALVLVIGTNDLSLRDDDHIAANVEQLLKPLSGPLLLSTILPVDDRANPRLQSRVPRLASLAERYRELCSAKPGCQLLDSYSLFVDGQGRLDARWHEGDGIHLNPDGYRRWQQAIRSALVQMSVVVAP